MNSLHMVTFRCHSPLFMRMEQLCGTHGVDRTSLLKLALHFFLNAQSEETQGKEKASA